VSAGILLVSFLLSVTFYILDLVWEFLYYDVHRGWIVHLSSAAFFASSIAAAPLHPV